VTGRAVVLAVVLVLTDEFLLTRVDLADDGVIHDADDGGVEGPRPLVADGALVGLVPGCSVW
jgi:hypothetical protein